jgi:hypothetical protein
LHFAIPLLCSAFTDLIVPSRIQLALRPPNPGVTVPFFFRMELRRCATGNYRLKWDVLDSLISFSINRSCNNPVTISLRRHDNRPPRPDYIQDSELLVRFRHFGCPVDREGWGPVQYIDGPLPGVPRFRTRRNDPHPGPCGLTSCCAQSLRLPE